MVDRQYCRYFIEGLPQLLDTENEWCYVNEGEHKGRIYIRLKGERDPNDSIIELAKYYSFLDVKNKSNITVQGLNLKFFNRMNIRDKFKARNPIHTIQYFGLQVIHQTYQFWNVILNIQDKVFHFILIQMLKKYTLLDNFKINHNKISNMEDNAINCNLTEGMWDLRRLKIVKCFPGHSRIKTYPG